jgi:hypothetical protein
VIDANLEESQQSLTEGEAADEQVEANECMEESVLLIETKARASLAEAAVVKLQERVRGEIKSGGRPFQQPN